MYSIKNIREEKQGRTGKIRLLISLKIEKPILQPTKTAIFEKRMPLIADFPTLPATFCFHCVYTDVRTVNRPTEIKQTRKKMSIMTKINVEELSKVIGGGNGFGWPNGWD